jgi:hypothetical protein
MIERQKTPIQKALDRVSYHENSTKSLMNRETLRRLRVTLENLLEEEKTVIKEAFTAGEHELFSYFDEKLDRSENYYNSQFETYIYDKSDCESL